MSRPKNTPKNIKEELENLRKQLEDTNIADDIPRLSPEIIEEPISGREYAFCIHYALTGNGAESARKAGYSAKYSRVQASRMLKLQKIRKMVDQLQVELIQAKTLNKDIIKVELIRLAQLATIQEKPDFNTILKVYDMINKMDGNYESQDTTTININDIKSIEVKINKPNQNK